MEILGPTVRSNEVLKTSSILQTIFIGFVVIGVLNKENYFMSISALLCILIYSFLTIDSKILAIFFLLPFQSYFVLIGNFTVTTVCGLILLITFVYFRRKIDVKTLLSMVIFLIFQLLSSFIFQSNLFQSISFVCTLLLMYYLVEHFNGNRKDYYVPAAKIFIFAVLLSSTLAIAPMLSDYLSGISMPRFVGLWTNPNTLSTLLNISIALVLILTTEKRISIYLSSFCISLLGIYILLTYSRSAIFGLISILVIYTTMILFNKNGVYKKNSVNSTILKLLTLFCVIFISIFMYAYIIAPIIEKRGLIYTENSDFTHDRFSNLVIDYKWVINELDGFPLFSGFGINNSFKSISTIGKFTAYSTHNTYAEMLLDSGFFGFSCWAYFLYRNLKIHFHSFLRLRLLFVYVMLFYSLSSLMHTSDYAYMLLALISCYDEKINIL